MITGGSDYFIDCDSGRLRRLHWYFSTHDGVKCWVDKEEHVELAPTPKEILVGEPIKDFF